MARFFNPDRALAVLGCGLAILLYAPVPLAAQSDRPPAPAGADLLKQRNQELEAIRLEQQKAAEAEAKLRQDIEQLGNDRRRLNEALLETAGKIRNVETELNATEARIKPLETQEQVVRNSLDARRSVIAEILATLQRMGRRPPPVLITEPEDALQSIRAAIVLGSVLPDMRERANALAADLTKLIDLRKSITAEKTKLARDLTALSDERQRMSLLVEERQKKQAETEKSLDTERQHAMELARQADSLKDLIAKLEQSVSRARPGDDGKPGGRNGLAALNDPGRLMPAVAFASARGMLPIPVSGVKSRSFGDPDGLGGVEKGISIATREGAQVTSPCDAWVVYAGPFRSYGQLLILNAGGGYHVVLAGMERISVDPGQFVLTGEPVAVMGSGAHIAAAVPTGASQPVLYVEFRKDGVPVDSGPWWATSESEKVRG
jgi:septal ring factor EnvC (AmiA/AmiB activator)